jgi:hypothetical protein
MIRWSARSSRAGVISAVWAGCRATPAVIAEELEVLVAVTAVA